MGGQIPPYNERTNRCARLATAMAMCIAKQVMTNGQRSVAPNVGATTTSPSRNALSIKAFVGRPAPPGTDETGAT